jgi:hypothetical protein
MSRAGRRGATLGNLREAASVLVRRGWGYAAWPAGGPTCGFRGGGAGEVSPAGSADVALRLNRAATG